VLLELASHLECGFGEAGQVRTLSGAREGVWSASISLIVALFRTELAYLGRSQALVKGLLGR